jgi:plastocyanin
MKNSKIIWVMLLATFLLWSAKSTLAGTIKGKVKVRGLRSPKDVVVYIDKLEGEFKSPKAHAKMDQQKMVFLPHVLPIVAGTTVDFHNNDSLFHNVFTPDKCADKFNLGTWGQDEIRSYTYKEAGCVSTILCNVHPEMEACLKVWHKKARGPDQEVTVPEEGEVTVDLKMKRKR